MPFDAFLFQSFGGPNTKSDVIPFLENVTRGRNIPVERLETVAQQYYHFNGQSPINKINLGIIERLQNAFSQANIALPIYFGNRNFEPYLKDALIQMKADGRTNAISFVTSAYGSFSSCKQYKLDIESACQEIGGRFLAVTKIRHFYSHPGFINPLITNSVAALKKLPHPDRAQLVFTAHSIPVSMSETSPYLRQLKEAVALVANGIKNETGVSYDYSLAFQSRSGAPGQAWLEPDISDHLKALSAKNITDALIVPIGFISDHLEVIYDLDILAANTAQRLGISISRTRTSSDSPAFVQMIVELTKELINNPITYPEPDCTATCCQSR
ncbi:MAG: ferrochelatase [Acidimicrobiaceae bacterium]|nr:ferrochelatase [Acidimicrobiaceae bacterium]